MVQPLRGLDAAFLYFETTDTPLNVAQVCVFDPSTGPGGSPYEQLRGLLERRLDRLAPFRQRLVGAPAGLGHPVWVEDPDFDLDHHLRAARLPAPGDAEELARFTADFLEGPLDRAQPLWEMRVVEGLAGGLVAGVTKMHHSAIDGLSGAELTANLLDLEPFPPPDPDPVPRAIDPLPSTWQLGRHAAADWLRRPGEVTGRLGRAGAAASRVWRLNRSSSVPPPPAPFSAPPTPLNTRVGRRRRVAFAELDLAGVRSVRDAFGATVNDVALAVCAGALITWLDGRGARPDKDLVAAVPVAVRSDDRPDTVPNRLSAMLIGLATTVEDPAARLAAIVGGSRRAKEQDRALGAETVGAVAGLLPPVVGPQIGRVAARLRVLERRPLFNVMISNFPGPPCPLYCAGAKLVAPYPIGPLISGAALNITMQSYLDQLFVGLVAEAGAVPDLDRLPGMLRDALDELVKQAA